MSKTLALGYAICIATLLAMISLARGALPQLDGYSTFFYTSLTGLLMFIGSILLFRGAKPSQGRVRKALAYLISVLAFCIGLSSAFAVTLVLLGSAKID